MLDLGLLARVKRVYAATPHAGVSLAEVLGIIDKESAGVPYFYGSEVMFRPNINMILRRYKIIGIGEHQVKQVITIPAGELKGKWSKFRYEDGYFHWAHQYGKDLSLIQQILLSCSVGLGQQMLRFVVQTHPAGEALDRAYKFMGDIDEQIRWVIGNLRDNYHTNRQLVYARYNGGPGVRIGGQVYSGYGADVSKRVALIQKWLEESKLT